MSDQLTLAHRSASGTLCAWEFDPTRRVIIVCVPNHDPHTAKFEQFLSVDVPVCTYRNARHNAYLVRRVDSECWEVVPSRYATGLGTFKPAHFPFVELTDPVTGMVHTLYPLVKDTIVLTRSPAQQTAELMTL